MKRIVLGLTLVALWTSTLHAQTPGAVFQPGQFRDGVYDKENASNRKFIPYTFLRQGDVMWQKRVWRTMDLREKINQPLFYPLDYITGRQSLIQVLQEGIISGDVHAFSYTDEEFMAPLTISEVKSKFVRCDSITQQDVDKDGNPTETRIFKCDSGETVLRKVISYKIKEDWFFDKQKSVLEVRILGLCPREYMEDKGEYKDWFWVYFPECRPLFARKEVFNTKNDAERRTFDDVFWKRQFNSMVVKETNVYDRNIFEYANGIDGLLESDRVKNDIFQFEHDLWHF